MSGPVPASDEVLSAYDYDPSTGIFTRCLDASRMPGTRAGWTDTTGYRKIRVSGREFLEHHVAWLVTYGYWPDEIDHRNGIPSDNRISNLRLADRSQNNANKVVSKRSLTGMKGVSPSRDGKAWVARIKVKNRSIHLGTFRTVDLASAAYNAASLTHFGEFSFTQRPSSGLRNARTSPQPAVAITHVGGNHEQ